MQCLLLLLPTVLGFKSFMLNENLVIVFLSETCLHRTRIKTRATHEIKGIIYSLLPLHQKMRSPFDPFSQLGKPLNHQKLLQRFLCGSFVVLLLPVLLICACATHYCCPRQHFSLYSLYEQYAR
jgi:hypothetical protein